MISNVRNVHTYVQEVHGVKLCYHAMLKRETKIAPMPIIEEEIGAHPSKPLVVISKLDISPYTNKPGMQIPSYIDRLCQYFIEIEGRAN